MAKRLSKMKCLEVKTNKYQTRKSPPFHAYQCSNKIRKGKDGMYKSVEDKNGRWFWKKNNKTRKI
jgi:hypothetical protein